jgi:transformation/transcription domain-associated protein
MLIAKKQLAVQNAARASSGHSASHASGGETSSQASVEQSVNGDSLSPKRENSSTIMPQGSARGPHSGFENLRSSSPSGKTDASSSTFPRAPSQASVPNSHPTPDTATAFTPRLAGDHIEELFQILKTAFPLLVLSMETLVDQITTRFKATPDEEAYRILCILLQDFLSVSTHHQKISS